MNIGRAAAASGVTAKLIRYYEEIGLVRPAGRTPANYRDFDERSIHELRFIRVARSLGFSVPEIAELLSLWRDPSRDAEAVRTMADARVQQLEERAAGMTQMAEALRALAASCAQGERPQHPVLGPSPPRPPAT
ncbi:MerR family DNA-binding protein [Phenylobacterium soli]|uniref:Cu(I)-responsive transcriptional regulator n=1 Tax=Phenylobacterium soli TaxID=2170551 RepID=A0A328AHC8_9CAUL|nr:MerR family DNA-binding protein [Phenylobacterium soli]RAK54150.1 Cu(I)-responsive transcriptional regulator [Phenylobacterium soli]